MSARPLIRALNPEAAVLASVISSSEGPGARDPWGRPFLHFAGASGTRFIGGVSTDRAYSAGENGVDEGGHGDDVVLDLRAGWEGTAVVCVWVRFILASVLGAFVVWYMFVRLVPPLSRLGELGLCTGSSLVCTLLLALSIALATVLVPGVGRLLWHDEASRPVGGAVALMATVLCLAVGLTWTLRRYVIWGLGRALVQRRDAGPDGEEQGQRERN